MSNSLEVLIIGKVWPEPGSSAAGSRMMQLINLFKSKESSITFVTSAGESDFAVNLGELDINTKSVKMNDSGFDEFIAELQPDIVIFDRFMTEEQFGWRVTEQCSDAIKILDTEDLHGLRSARETAVKAERELTTDDLFNDFAKREVASILRCDLSLIISSYEMKLLQTIFQVNRSLIYYLPFMLPPLNDKAIRDWKKFEDRVDFISIGNFLHTPNWDAVRYLKEQIWPKIKVRIPEANLKIYGAYASQKVYALDDPANGFFVLGRAEDAKEVISNSRVMLAPLRFGAGLKGKLADAMQTGTPSITTNIGAEGMHGDAAWPGAIQDDPDEFADAAVRIYTEKTAWETARRQGIIIINHLFNEQLLGEDFWFRVHEIRSNLKSHRGSNFLGSMLMHHSLNSVKYMGKWIEEKEKSKIEQKK